MAKISLFILGCLLVEAYTTEPCKVRTWDGDWKKEPSSKDLYHEIWVHCMKYPEDNPCQLCHLPRCHPEHKKLQICLKNPYLPQCVKFRPVKPQRAPPIGASCKPRSWSMSWSRED